MTTTALIVAAGRGTRLGADVPKQYLPLPGPCALRRSVDRFLSLDEIAEVQVVIHADDTALYAEAVEGLNDPRLAEPVTGAATRAGSVLKGLEALETRGPDKVLIHDAARAFVPQDVIRAVIHALETCEGACAALPVVDALWSSEGDQADKSVPRECLWRAQTPQGFDFAKILSAQRAHAGAAADDVAIAREAGLSVRFVLGSEQSFKITTPGDLARAALEIDR